MVNPGKYSFLMNEYIKKVNQSFGRNIDILLYGSASRGKLSSDLDVCILKSNYDEEDKQKIKNLTIDFHKEQGLKLDFDVPYEQKCIYSFQDMLRVIENPPFKVINNKFALTPIIMEKEYLASNEVKDRLLLNILTTDSKIIYGDNVSKLNTYKAGAWNTLLKLIYSYTDNLPKDKFEFVDSLCQDPISGVTHKGFLGYAKDNAVMRNYLLDKFETTTDLLVKDGAMFNHGGKYSFNPLFLENFLSQQNQR